jgi:hypothetical protein
VHRAPLFHQIDAWFNVQRCYAFYSSSVLLVFEGDDTVAAATSQQCDTDVRMIDFTHVFPTTDYDANYVNGLRTFQMYLARAYRVWLSGRDGHQESPHG